MSAPVWRPCRITRITNETPNTRRYILEVPGLPDFNFQPGQFVTLDLPIHDSPPKRRRSYSIASCPNGKNEFELVIVLQKDGAGTEYLFSQATEGTEFTFRGPLGKFTLPAELGTDLLLICTGTGVAPFRSMVHHIHRQGIAHKNIHLVFGTRKREDILYYNEFRELERQMPGFYYHPVLSRGAGEGLAQGYVHGVYEQLCAQKQPAEFYLCGWKDMVNEARTRIEQMGYERSKIHLELYG